MKRLTVLLTLYIGVALAIFSCKSNEQISQREADDMYFMASDVTPINQLNSFNFMQENFSERNINPEYIARYQAEFDNTVEAESEVNIQVYNNYFNGERQGFLNPIIGGFYPFGLGMYDPFWRGGWGFRPNVFIGGGWVFMNQWVIGSNFGFTDFYDPFFNPFFPAFRPGLNGFYSGFGWNRDVYRRQTIRGVRPARSTSLSVVNRRQLNTPATPNGARSVARKSALPNRAVNQGLPRTNTREDFRSSQNDYYNSAKPAMPSRRTTQTPTVNRELSRNGERNTRSSYRAVTPNTNTSPSRRTSSPNYNRITPARSTPTYSTPSRNSGNSRAGSIGTRRGN